MGRIIPGANNTIEITPLRKDQSVPDLKIGDSIYLSPIKVRPETVDYLIPENRQALYQKAILAFGKKSQLWMVVEECSEWIKDWAKRNRSGVDMVPETADIYIMAEQMMLITGTENTIPHNGMYPTIVLGRAMQQCEISCLTGRSVYRPEIQASAATFLDFAQTKRLQYGADKVDAVIQKKLTRLACRIEKNQING